MSSNWKIFSWSYGRSGRPWREPFPPFKTGQRRYRTYSADGWGEARADNYIRQIYAVAGKLAARPTLARSCDDLRQGYRKHRVGSHLIYLRVVPNGVELVRILHIGMNPRLHL